jgi:small-conductance mechanosensitive channel
MFPKIFKFIKSLVKSRAGQMFFLIHLILFVYWVASLIKYPPEEFHAHAFYKFFFVVLMFDYPFMLLLNPLIYYFGLFQTQLGVSLVGFIISFQWWMVGYLAEAVCRGLKNLIKSLFD